MSALKWKVQPDANASPSSNLIRERSYKFDYDRMDRLKKATYQAFGTTAWNQEVGGYNEELTYDHNGNILSLKRNSWASSTATAPSLIDNLTYTYTAGSGNQLKKVEDAASPTEGGFKNNSNIADEYGYDQNGNLTRDNNKNGGTGVTYLYNELNKVSQVTLADGKRIVYTYDGSGARIRKQLFAANTTTAFKTTDYVGGFVYENQILSYFSMPEGRVRTSGTSFVYEYFLSDHLGNTRVSFEAYFNGTTTTARLTQENHYYPYGLSMQGIAIRTPAPSSAPNKQFYNGGSELQNFGDDFWDEPSNYSTFYREYDPVLGRFNAVDPKTDKYSSLSAYHFAFNNPISYNDPMGDDPTSDGISDTAQRRTAMLIDQGYAVWGPGSSSFGTSIFDVGNMILAEEKYDKELARRAQTGDTQATQEYIHRHSQRIEQLTVTDHYVDWFVNGEYVDTHYKGTSYSYSLVRQGGPIPVFDPRRGGFIDNYNTFYAYMLNAARTLNVEVAAFEILDPRTNRTIYYVLPWETDEFVNTRTMSRSNPNEVPGYKYAPGQVA